MIDGYSVQEAASVLGVPEGRVWELLARGVLGGLPDGDSMRVFLKNSPGPTTPARGGAAPVRDNGGEATAEASAFRELLTEFRNLTERYGQALLALGEARGEVAGLRARVELLESRVDLRLAGPALDPIAWSPAPGPAPEPRQTAKRPPELHQPAAAAPRGESRADTRRRPAKPAPAARPPRKAPGQRRAVAGIAEALARAEDPSTRALPTIDAAAVAASSASIESTFPPESVTPDAGESLPSPYSTDVVEPDWFADGDFAWLEAAEREAAAPVAEAEPSPPAPDAAGPDEAVVELESAPRAYVESLPAEPATPAEPIGEQGPAPLPQPQPGTLSLTEEELAQLAADEGWGPSEVDTIRSLIGSDEPPSLDLPGSAELDAALAALDAPATEDQWSKPHLDVPLPEITDQIDLEDQHLAPEPVVPEAAPEPVRAGPAPPPLTPAQSAPSPASSPRPVVIRPVPSEPSWLRGRRGPAAAAFRTLRRLLPG